MKIPSHKDIIRWAMYLYRLSRRPRVFKPGRDLGPFNKSQEMARRRRQMIQHGANYWCPIWRG